MKLKMLLLLLAVAAICVCAIPFRTQLRQALAELQGSARGEATVSSRTAEYGEAARARMAPSFQKAGVQYPPARLAFVGLKEEHQLEVWAAEQNGPWRLVKSYPVLAASGTLGPKLRKGDRQVPEGIYQLESLNPNSLYHLSLRIGYPNESERRHGREDGRENLGGDIMIHGKDCSIGCLAMGDEAAEELFVLAAETGTGNVSIILCPLDMRVRKVPAEALAKLPPWTPQLYAEIERALLPLKAR